MHFSNNKQRYRAYYLRDNAFVVGTSALPVIYYIITTDVHTQSVYTVNTLKREKGKMRKNSWRRPDTRDAGIAVKELLRNRTMWRDENGMAYEFHEILTMSGKEARA